MTRRPENQTEDGSVGTTLWTVALVGAVLTFCSPLLFGVQGVVSTGVGALLAVGNLWAIARLVRGLISGSGAKLAWGPLSAIKLLGLFLVLYVLLRYEVARVLPLAFGYLALPLGIVFSQLRPSSPAQGEN